MNPENLIESIRRRPGMYFGSTGSTGVEHFIYELVSNVLDLYLMHQATFVTVLLNEDIITVMDDGPGLPFNQASDTPAITLATQFLTQVHWTASHDNHVPHVHMTTAGLGLAPVNIASSQFNVKSWRSGMLWEQNFARGMFQNEPIIIDRGNDLGTIIEVIPDAELFGESKPRHHVIRRALFEISHLFSGLKVGFNEEIFYAAHGLKMLGHLYLDYELSFLYSSPFHYKAHHENIGIEIAIFGETQSQSQSQSQIHSWVNGARTPDHGTHVEGLIHVLQENQWKPVLILIHVILYDPQFAGPMKTRLNVPYVRDVFQTVLPKPLQDYCSNTKF
jgi:DNA gyrase subunit B